jgi:hypothetical protein
VTALLEAALGYAPRTIPLPPRSKAPVVKDWPNWHATPDKIREHWGYNPEGNVGIRTGKGLVVLDIDPRAGGDKQLAALEAQHGKLPATVECVTGGGGRHLYFRGPAGLRSRDLAPGVEIKAEGRQVVAPPSVHPETGRAYQWANGRRLSCRGDIAEMPDWLASAAVKAGSAGRDIAEIVADPPAEGTRHRELLRLVGKLFADGYDTATVGRLARGWNRELSPPLPDAEVERAVADIAAKESAKRPEPIPAHDLRRVTAELLERVRAFLRAYVVLPSDDAAEALSLWVLHSWALEAAEVTPYLIVLSPERRSGKTLLLELLRLLVRKPWHLASASEAAMFRKITNDRPTLLLDEVDAIFGPASTDRTEALRAVLNAGNRRGSSVARCVGKGAEQDVVDFEVFCAKLLAGIDTGRLPDTIRDRGVELRMKRKAAGEEVQRFRRRDVEPLARDLTLVLEAWAATAVDVLRDARPDLPDELNDRTADAWEPLLAIADLAGTGDRARTASLVLAGQADVDETSHGTRLLAKLRELMQSSGSAVTSAALVHSANSDMELPFGGWRNGKGIDARGVARLLKPYGLQPKTVRAADGTTPKGYALDAAVEEAFARYLPLYPSGSATSATSATSASPATHPPQEAWLGHGDVADVADVADVDGYRGTPPPQVRHKARHNGHRPAERTVEDEMLEPATPSLEERFRGPA